MATSAPAYDFDPTFLKALQLLHSRSKDSADQLKQMLDEVLQQKSGSSLPPHRESKVLSSFNPIKHESDSSSKGSSAHSSPRHLTESLVPKNKTSFSFEEDLKRKTNLGKKLAEKLTSKVKMEIPDVSSSKKIKMEATPTPSTSRSSSPSSQPSSPSSRSEQSNVNISDSEDEEQSTETTTDFAREMGLVCVVCKLFNMKSGNTLVECQECHNLYHKECHTPVITDKEATDPRLVWYCMKCTKQIKKIQTSKTQKPSKPVQTPSASLPKDSSLSSSSFSSSTGSVLGQKLGKPELNLSQQLFKRSELKPTPQISTSNAAQGNKPTGLAGLAAIFTKAPSTSSTGGISSNSKVSFQSALLAGSTVNSSKSSISSSIKSGNQGQSSSNNGSKQAGKSVISGTSSSSSSLLLQGASGSSKSGGGSGSSSSGNNGGGGGGGGSGSSIMNADKRLQIMKKKAAAKMQEKRRMSNK